MLTISQNSSKNIIPQNDLAPKKLLILKFEDKLRNIVPLVSV